MAKTTCAWRASSCRLSRTMRFWSRSSPTASACPATRPPFRAADHKRVPEDIAEQPVIIGHEFCGEIVEVGAKWQGQVQGGREVRASSRRINYKGSLASPGYSYQYCRRRRAPMPSFPTEVMEMNCLLDYKARRLLLRLPVRAAELHHRRIPRPCITPANGSYVHEMGIKEGGNAAILAGAGPMGLGTIDYAIHCDRKPGLLVVTDIDQARLDRAASHLHRRRGRQERHRG